MLKPSRRSVIAGAAAAGLLPAFRLDATPTTSRALWFTTPADEWTDALPVGNGRLGAMMFGGVERERLHLSESTLWSGAPSTMNVNPAARSSLDHIRQLMFEGQDDEADTLCEQNLCGRMEQFGTALPMGWLEIAFPATGSVQDYRRWLDLGEGIAGVAFRSGGVRYRRELFASAPDGVLLLNIESDRIGGLSGMIGFGDVRLPGRIEVRENGGLRFYGQALETLHSDGAHGVRFVCGLRILVDTGTVRPAGFGLEVTGATRVTIALAVASDFDDPRPAATVDKRLALISRRGYARLRAAHVADHAALFRRASLQFGPPTTGAVMPTDARRAAVAAGGDDPDLAALFFDFGRYLTIAGSRADSPLPLALQGIWNDGRAAAMGWADDFHLDINTQQNYWACEVANLADCHAPLWRLLQKLRRAGSVTASEMYGAGGWVAHVYTNPWGFTAPGSGKAWGIFVTGGVWIALDLWDHYRFGLDIAFLRGTAWPVLRDAATFFLDYMVEHPSYHWLVTGPSISPENGFRSPKTGRTINNSMGPTCDTVLVRTLFSACIDASHVLGEDAAFRARLVDARDRMAPLRVGKHGQLQEWLDDYEEAQPSHRHTSHLVALYPYHEIDPLRTPALAQAARTTIARRTSQPDWEDTEWGRANFAAFYARLRDGEAAEGQIRALITRNASASLLAFSPNGVAGAESKIFAIDANMGGTAAIAEMLVQSDDVSITLLPALPRAWRTGSFEGLRGRGDVEVTAHWQKGIPGFVKLLSKRNGGRYLRFGSRSFSIEFRAHVPRILTETEIAELTGVSPV